MINNRFKNSFKSVKTYPVADVRTDHNPVVGVLSCQLKTIKKKSDFTKFNVRKLAENNIRLKVSSEIIKWALNTKQQASKLIEEIWLELKTVLSNVSNKYLKSTFSPKQVSMTGKISNLMDERRLYKNVDVIKYNYIDKQIRREVCYARDQWYLGKCKHVERLYEKHDAFNLHKEIRFIVGTAGQIHRLVDEMGLPVLDVQKKKQMWEQYEGLKMGRHLVLTVSTLKS